VPANKLQSKIKDIKNELSVLYKNLADRKNSDQEKIKQALINTNKSESVVPNVITNI